jgi:ribonuclease HI
MRTVFTDGACAGNPGPGGWAWALADASQQVVAHGSGSEKQSTNQRMEVWAVLDALTTMLAHVDEDVEIVSDSTYVVNCFRDSWWRGWEGRGWKNSQKQPVANQDLWKPLVALYKEHAHRISFRWVKGHSGNKMNDAVDTLAVAAGAAQLPRTIVGLENVPFTGLTPPSAQSSEPPPNERAVNSLEPHEPGATDGTPLTLF